MARPDRRGKVIIQLFSVTPLFSIFKSAVVVRTAFYNILHITGHTLWENCCDSDHRAVVRFKSCTRQRNCIFMYLRLTLFIISGNPEKTGRVGRVLQAIHWLWDRLWKCHIWVLAWYVIRKSVFMYLSECTTSDFAKMKTSKCKRAANYIISDIVWNHAI